MTIKSAWDFTKSHGTLLIAVAALGYAIWRPAVAPTPMPPGPPPVPSNIIKAPVGRLTTFNLPTKGEAARWLIPPQQADSIDIGEYTDHVVLVPLKEGVYDLGAAVMVAGKIDVLWWRVESGLGPLPPPIPPGPLPPEPPVPSKLTKELQAAYVIDLDPYKTTNTPKLANILGGIVPLARSATPPIVTAKQFQTFVKSKTDAEIGERGIPKVRAAVGAYLVTVLPIASTATADEAYWAKAASEYGYVSLALKGVK